MAIVVAAGQSVAQPDWDALAAQHGGPKSTTKLGPSEAQIKEAALAGDDDPSFQQRPIYRYYFNDGTYVDARTAPNGADYAVVDYKPSSTYKPSAASADESVSAPSNQPNIVTRQPDGSFVTTPNPNYQPPAPAPRTPEQQTADAAAAQTAQATAQSTQAENNEKQWNSQHGYGWVTHAARDAAIRQQETQARADKNQDRLAAAQEASNQLSRDRLQFDKDKANLPTVKVEDVPVNGQKYVRVTTVGADGKAVSIRAFGPDNKPVDRIPSEGEASRGGPSMVQYVRDGSIQGLTTYHTALYGPNADPNITPEQRDKRFQEAVQVANLAVQQAATDQRERESTRNAEYNTASTKLTFMQNGMTSALDFVSKLNGSLPEGSDLGGRAFAALLGLNMLQIQRSGINNLPSMSAPRAPLPTITAADLSKPAALATVNQAIAQHAAEAAAPAPVAPAPPAQQNAGQGTGEAPSRGALPAQPSMPTAAPSMTTPGAPPPTVTADQAAGYYGHGVNPATGDAIAPGLDQNLGQPGDPAYDPTVASPAPPLMKLEETPDYGQPGMRVLPQPEAKPPESSYGEGQDMPKVSLDEWPALQGAGIAAAPTPPMMQLPGQPPSMEMPPAARRAQIATLPPWRLTPEQMQEAEQNGWLDDAMRIPGRVA